MPQEHELCKLTSVEALEVEDE